MDTVHFVVKGQEYEASPIHVREGGWDVRRIVYDREKDEHTWEHLPVIDLPTNCGRGKLKAFVKNLDANLEKQWARWDRADASRKRRAMAWVRENRNTLVRIPGFDGEYKRLAAYPIDEQRIYAIRLLFTPV
jgi:hypothetical protein